MLPRNQDLPIHLHNYGYVRNNWGENPHEPVAYIQHSATKKLLFRILLHHPCLITFLLTAPRSLNKTFIIKAPRSHPDHQPKYPVSSSGFSDSRLAYRQRCALVAPLPRTKKSVEKCIKNGDAEQVEQVNSPKNMANLYLVGLKGSEYM